jgi:hypothetical protein
LESFVEIFFIKEDFVPVVPVFVEFFAAFRNGNVVVISMGCPHIKEVSSSFPGTDAFAINAFHTFVVVFVRHSHLSFAVNNYQIFTKKSVTNIILF